MERTMAGHMTLFRYAMTRPGEMAFHGAGSAMRTRPSFKLATLATALLAVVFVF
jgi:hypothetical protein